MKHKILILSITILIILSGLVSANYDLSVESISTTPNNPIINHQTNTSVKITNNGPLNVINESITLNISYGDGTFDIHKIINLSAGEDITFSNMHQWNNTGNFLINASLSGMINDSNPSNDFRTKEITTVSPFVNISSEDKTLNNIFRNEQKEYQVKVSNSGNVDAEIINAYITDLSEINGNETFDNSNFEVKHPDLVKANSFDYDELKVFIPTNTKPSSYEGNLTTVYKDESGNVNTTISEIILIVSNHPANVEGINDQITIIGQEFNYQVQANDPENDTLTFSLSNEPIGMSINSSTGLIKWIPTNTITKTVTVSVNDGFNTSSVNFQISSKIDAPELSTNLNEIELGNSDSERGEQVTSSYTIKNTGTQPITNLVVELLSTANNNLSSKYDGVSSISKTSLAVGEEAIVSVGITIPEDEDSERHLIGKIRVKGEGTTSGVHKENYLSLEAESFLKIKEVVIKVNGDEESLDDGETYNDIKEGDSVKLTITLENKYSSNDDIKIEDTYVKIEDDNWDISEKSSRYTIKEDDEKEIEINFKVPDDLDDDLDRIIIKAYGDDEENDFEHFDSYEINLEIDRENHELKIKSWELSNNPVSCKDGIVTLRTTIKNTGLDDEDEGLLRAFSGDRDLNWQKIISDIELDSGDSETFNINIPVKDKKTGIYYVQLKTYYDTDEESDSTVIKLNIVCETETNPNVNLNKKNNTITVVTKQDNNDLSNNKENKISFGQAVTAKESFRNSEAYILTLLIIVLILLISVIILGVKLIKKK